MPRFEMVGGHRPPLQSENVFQRKLHDARVTRRVDEAESGERVQVHSGVHLDQAVGHVERLGSELQPLTLLNAEYPGQCRVELPGTGTLHAVASRVSKRTQRGLRERCSVEVTSESARIAVRITEYLIGSLLRGRCARKRAINAATDRQRRTCHVSINSRNAPARSDKTHLVACKLRCLSDCRHIEILTAVLVAI